MLPFSHTRLVNPVLTYTASSLTVIPSTLHIPLSCWFFSADNLPVRAIDDGQESPSLQRLLTGDMVDDTCRVRLWVEQRRDGGFWEAEKKQPRLPMSTDIGKPPSPPAIEQEFYGGVRLACMTDMPRWDMQQSLAWGTAGGEASLHPERGSGQPSAAPSAAPSAVDTGGMEDPNVPITPEEGGTMGAGAGDEDVRSTGKNRRPRQERILVFLKTLGVRRRTTGYNRGAATGAATIGREDMGEEGGGRGGGIGSGGRSSVRPEYLTHAILRSSSPLRALFELAADRIGDGTRPEDLGAYLEDLPCAWQDGLSGQKPSKVMTRGDDS